MSKVYLSYTVYVCVNMHIPSASTSMLFSKSWDFFDSVEYFPSKIYSED